MSNYDLNQARNFFRQRLAYTTGVHELEVAVTGGKGGFQVADVRYPADYAAGHVPGAINLPKGKWTNPKNLSKDQPVYVYCYDQTCHLGAEAALALAEQGFQAIEVEGGWDRWTVKGFRVESESQAA